jgi:hypothetical protein
MAERRNKRKRRFGETQSLYHTPAHAKNPVPVTAENYQDYLAEAALFAPSEANGRPRSSSNPELQSDDRGNRLDAEHIRVFSHREKSNVEEPGLQKFKHIARYRPPATTADSISAESVPIIRKTSRMASTSGQARTGKSSGVRPAFSQSAAGQKPSAEPSAPSTPTKATKPAPKYKGDDGDQDSDEGRQQHQHKAAASVAPSRQNEIDFLSKSFTDERSTGAHNAKKGSSSKSAKVIDAVFEPHPEDSTELRKWKRNASTASIKIQHTSYIHKSAKDVDATEKFNYSAALNGMQLSFARGTSTLLSCNESGVINNSGDSLLIDKTVCVIGAVVTIDNGTPVNFSVEIPGFEGKGSVTKD